MVCSCGSLRDVIVLAQGLSVLPLQKLREPQNFFSSGVHERLSPRWRRRRRRVTLIGVSRRPRSLSASFWRYPSRRVACLASVGAMWRVLRQVRHSSDSWCRESANQRLLTTRSAVRRQIGTQPVGARDSFVCQQNCTRHLSRGSRIGRASCALNAFGLFARSEHTSL